MTILYRFAQLMCQLIFKIGFGLKVTNNENADISGGVVLVSNHISNWDSLLIAALFNKTQIYYFAKSELFKKRFFATILGEKGLGAIPINRGEADFFALKKSIEVLKSDQCLGVFPEGTRNKNGIGEFQRGFASMAIKSNARILPVYIDGNYQAFKKMHLIIGEPIYPDKVCDVKLKNASMICTQYVKDKIIELKENYSIY